MREQEQLQRPLHGVRRGLLVSLAFNAVVPVVPYAGLRPRFTLILPTGTYLSISRGISWAILGSGLASIWLTRRRTE